MKQYLLSIYQPDGTPPPKPVLDKIMDDVRALREEIKAAGCIRRARPPSFATKTATC